MNAGDAESTIRLASEVLDEEPDNIPAFYMITRSFVDLGRPGFAKVFGKRCTELDPNQAAAWVNYGNAHQISFDLEGAIRCNSKALELDPKDFAALSNLALAYNSSANPEKALEYIARSEEISPNDPDTKENKGYCQLMLHQWQEGWKNYNITVGRNSDRKRRSYLEA